ncbi:MAG: zinc-binding dehydrogenase [Deltaproteobacteria bacterium]|jgi:enoyl-CoA hydratase|nr:zinc-binding dehydrogenase [Deltaproteobacteria bacterium]
MTTNSDRNESRWPLGVVPNLAMELPDEMYALTLHRDQYGPPAEVVKLEIIPRPKLTSVDAGRVLVAVLATGPNFNTNFAALGLPVPVFGKGDSATLHIPGSDALGIVVEAGPAVTNVKVGQAVILDAWTGKNLIRGYETHNGFNAQFAVMDEIRAIPITETLAEHSPERLAAMMLTHGTAYRAVVERLMVQPGDSVLLMGGGKGTSFAGAQIAKSLGARVILMGSNLELGAELMERGIADAFVDRRKIPAEVFGLIDPETDFTEWMAKTESFRKAVFDANKGQAVDKIFEHTGGLNFPLLVSALREGGRLEFFGATGKGMKGEYKETFFYDDKRFVLDARWAWMRQKQIIFRNSEPDVIFSEISLLPGRNGLIWGADAYALSFAEAALKRSAKIAVIASRTKEQEGISALERMGIPSANVIDRDGLMLPPDMPDPLTQEGTPNPAYNPGFMDHAKIIGKALWEIFGPRVSPDFIVERTDQSTLHFSTFLVRDHDEPDEMPCGIIVARGKSNLSILGSHMYQDAQAREVVRLLSEKRIVLAQEDLDITDLAGIPHIQQKMLDGAMQKPKGVALVQADRAGRSIAEYESAFLGETLKKARPDAHEYLDVHLCNEVGIITLKRIDALNALNHDLVEQLGAVMEEVKADGTLLGKPVGAIILRGAGRAFGAGADVTEFHGNTAKGVARIAAGNISVLSDMENLSIPVIALIDGFALGGGNELAMSAHYRIVTQNALLGQPEVKLGIFPGYGGMQRLPRLVGPLKAAEMCINGESIGPRKAVDLGLADAFAPASMALTRAFKGARRHMKGEIRLGARKWDQIAAEQKEELDALLNTEMARGFLAASPPDAETAKDIKLAREYAAGKTLQAMQFGYENGFVKGLENDARLFGEAAASASGQEWIGRFINKDPLQSSFLALMPEKK